jgi:hypothetical protein
MAKVNVLDTYPNMAVLSVAGTAATTGNAFGQIQTGITNLQKIAWNVLRAEYFPPGDFLSQTLFVTPGTYLTMGISQSEYLLAGEGAERSPLIDMCKLTGGATASAVGLHRPFEVPFVHDFSGGRLALPQTLYAWLNWSTTVALFALQLRIRIWYREVELTPEDWYDLLQLRLPMGSN